MQEEIVLTVIVTLHNREKYIEKCLRSILDQDFKKLEVILVNDCSTDDSLAIAQRLAEADKRLVIVNNEKNIGSGPSNNVGMERARGKYIAFVDGDDWIEQGAYAKLVKKMEESGADLCMFGVKQYFEADSRLVNYSYYDLSQLQEKLSIDSDIKSWPEEIFKHFATWSKIYRREFLNQKNIRFTDIRLGEDVPFSVNCLLVADKLAICRDFLYVYRIHGTSKMQVVRKKEHARDIISFITKVKSILDKTGNFSSMKFPFYEFVDGQYKFYMKSDVSSDDDFKYCLENGIKEVYDHKPVFSMDDIDISIIISVYNDENNIKRALDSALAQKYVNIEVICIDDGSSDGTHSILNAYAQKYKNLVVLTHTNRGLAASRNRGLMLARGMYIQFLDSDDSLAATACAELFSFAQTHGLDMCSFSGVNIRKGKLVKNSYWEYEGIPGEFINKAFKSSYIFEHLLKLPVSSCLTVYRNSFIKEINNEFPEGLCFEDNVFYLNAILQSGKFGILKRYLYYRLIHDRQITAQNDATVLDKFEINRRCFHIIDKRYNRQMALAYINSQFDGLIKHSKRINPEIKDHFDRNMIELCSQFLR